jgi:transcriptional regulator with XRE-family HTH domain
MPNHPLESTVGDYAKRIFSQRLRELMGSREINLDKLVELTGIHINTLRAYMSGERLPRIPQLFLLADAIDAPIDWLTGFGDWDGYHSVKLTPPQDRGIVH